MVLDKIDYKRVFHYFEQISGVPRGSGNNQAISEFLEDFAVKNKIRFIKDNAYNIIMFQEASKGYEHLPAVILQGHMDMVCEKELGSEHDFTKEGLALIIEDGYIKAKGTTLGADDGIAVAYVLAILSDKKMKHPPLEIIITTDEEIGMLGATQLNTSKLKGKYLINMDSQEEGILLSSCAGGVTGNCRYPVHFEERRGESINISIQGLLGGHSGIEIDKNRTNASLLLGRMLIDLENVDWSIEKIQGGLKDNAIPREAECTLVVKGDQKEILQKLQKRAVSLQEELSVSEPNLLITCQALGNGSYQTIDKKSLECILFHLLYAPNGVQVMSSHVEGLVESSLNMGVFHLESDAAYMTHAIRSSVGEYKKFLSNKLKKLTVAMGGTYTEQGDYPEWEYKVDSSFRNMVCQVYEKQYGKKLKVEAVHAGLECGIISKELPDVDIVSIGPDTLDIHTPEERLNIASAIRVYDFLVGILEGFCE